MGCTSSKEIPPSKNETSSTGALSSSKHHSNRSLHNKPTSNRSKNGNSNHGNHNTNMFISLDIRKLAKQKWKVDRGYSSGASSVASDSNDQHNDSIRSAFSKNEAGPITITQVINGKEVPFDPKSISKPSKALNRNVSEVSCLSELKETLEKDGDLAKTVVRIETPFDTPIEEIYDGVLDGKVLGAGVSGTVRRIVHRVTGINYAVKCLDLSLINTKESLLQLRNEIFIMCQLDHPNVMRIEEVYESNNEIYIVQEICDGGDLFDRLDQQPDYHYTESQCASLVKQMLSSVRYLHSKGIIHRDLKLENFLFSTPKEDSDLKLIDFGLSKHFEVGEHHCEKVGTPYTVAPEILRGNYDEKSDIWSLGVITFLLLCGETPFGGLDGENLRLVKENIMRAKVNFEPKEAWDLVSDAGKAFVRELLDPDSSKRPTAKQAQRSSWIQEFAKKDISEGNQLNPKTIDALMNFKESSEMQRLLSEVLSFTLLPEQIVDLRKEFEKLDSHGDGEITLGSLKRILLQNAEIGALGALSEHEVEEIFESVKLPVRKGERTIRWHEFLAACLSRAEIDDRNLRLAFDRLDTHRKGFITFDDLADILGNTTQIEALEKIWDESLQEINSRLDRITLHDFKRIMKGRPKEGMTAFLQSSPGIVPTFSDPSCIPELNFPFLSDVIEEEEPNSSLVTEQPVPESTVEQTEMEIQNLSSASSSSLFLKISSTQGSVRGNQRASIWASSGEAANTSSSSIGSGSRRASLPISLQGGKSMSSGPGLVSPLAANRALYRKSLLRTSIVSESVPLSTSHTRSFNNAYGNESKSSTTASLVMKRGSFFPVTSLLDSSKDKHDQSGETVDTNNDTAATVSSD